MALLVAFEVRVHAKGGWRIEAIFDDKVLAVDAAKRLQSRNGKLPIVVVEDSYDEGCGQSWERIIFRSEYFGDTIKVQPKRRKAENSTGNAEDPGNISKGSAISGPMVRQILMYLLLFLAIGAYFGLRYLK